MRFVGMGKEPVALAVETSSRIGSIALGFGDKIIGETSFSGFMKHSAEIFPDIMKLLSSSDIKPNQIEHIYISNGPGSFTGLRIAATIAKMMFLAGPIKIVTVDSLDVVAFNAIEAVKEIDRNSDQPDGASKDGIIRIAVIIDAKRGQFFIAEYNVKRNSDELCPIKLTDDLLLTAGEFCEKVNEEGTPVWVIGDGLLYYRQLFQNENINFIEEKYWSPRAACLYRLGREMAKRNIFADPLKFKPNYLYRPDIIIKQR